MQSTHGCYAMPIRLPERKARVKAVENNDPIDWVAVWAVSVGVCAVILAAIIYSACGDKFGASFVMLGAAALIAVFVRGLHQPLG